MPLLSQLVDVVINHSHCGFGIGYGALCAFLYAFQLGFHPLAFLPERFFIGIAGGACFIAASLGGLHQCAVGFRFGGSIAAYLFKFAVQGAVVVGLFNGCNLVVDSGDFLLTAAEEVARAQHVEYRRHESLLAVASCQISRECCDESQP